MENTKFLDGPEMMRRGKRLIRWHVPSDLDIREDRRLKLAKEGNPDAIYSRKQKLTIQDGFSFSGLKSSVLNYLNKCEMKGEEVNRADVAASFQEAVVDVLVEILMEKQQKNLDIRNLQLQVELHPMEHFVPK